MKRILLSLAIIIGLSVSVTPPAQSAYTPSGAWSWVQSGWSAVYEGISFRYEINSETLVMRLYKSDRPDEVRDEVANKGNYAQSIQWANYDVNNRAGGLITHRQL